MLHLPRARSRKRSRGQGLVEFALVLPIMLFLTLIALDFGRVYLGYINLQNMARIAANFAANNPDAWTGSGDADAKAQYRSQILADGAATNCALPKVSGTSVVPTPTFADGPDADSATNGLGDRVQVQISCTFSVITPIIAQVVGGSVTVSAVSNFPVKTGLTDPGSGGSGSGSAPNAAFSGNGVITPSALSGTAPFDVDFRDTSGGSPGSWSWVFPSGTLPDGTPSPTSTAQDPGIVRFASPGTYTVSMTASNFLGSDGPVTMAVTVAPTSAVNFVANPTAGAPGLNVTFADASTPGGTSYAWTYGAGQGVLTNPTAASVTHTYNTAGDFTVTLTVTYATGPVTKTNVGYIHIAVAQCTVPTLTGGTLKFNDAQAIWRNSTNKFTGTVIDAPGLPNGNYWITAQSLVAGSQAPCSSNITVDAP